jgi:glycosyltransferase involved in cell wall biosynthesis
MTTEKMKKADRTGLTISFIMTALNEEKNILSAINDTLNALDDYNIEGEIIVVNDGSTDSTGDIVREAMKKDNRVRMLVHDRPRGVGASFWDGVDSSEKDIVCWIPGDNENDPWEILRYFNLLEHVDIVIPFVYNKQVRSLFRNALSFIYRFIINTTFVVYLNYTNGTVLYRRSLLEELDYRSSGFFYQTDILIRLIKKGYLFAEVPYRLGARDGGASKAVTFPSFIQVVRGYLRLVKEQYYRKDRDSKKVFQEGTMTEKRYKEHQDT